MVRNYKRKTTKVAVAQDVFEQAKVQLEQGESIRTVAAKFGMDESTLRKRLKKVECEYNHGEITFHGRVERKV